MPSDAYSTFIIETIYGISLAELCKRYVQYLPLRL